MIADRDRSGYFGASDTSMVLTSNRQSDSFKRWWEVKLGEREPDFNGSIYTEAGNRYEHPILKAVSDKIRLDGQIIIKELRLRVNYDGDLDGVIYEVKTHKSEKQFEVSKAYWRQAQVEMYAYQRERADFRRLYIVSYPLYPDEYYEEAEIDFDRIKFSEVKYDKHFIEEEYLPRLKELAQCLKERRFPT